MKKIFSNPIHTSTVAAALILCVLCLALPVYQWASIPDVRLVQVLAGAAALALGICKLTFIPLAAESYTQGKRLPALCLFLVALLALAISVSASRDLLNNATLTKQQGSTVNSLTYKNAQTALNDLNAEIKTLNGLLAEDLANNFRERAYEKRANLEILKAERAAAAGKAERLASASPNYTGATFGKNITLSVSGFEVSLQAATGAALALHLACIFAVLAVTAWKPKENTQLPQVDGIEQVRQEVIAAATVKRASSKTKTGTAKTTPGTDQVLSDEQKRLAQDIVAGAHGNEPALRELINRKVIKGGFNKIRPVFNHLIEQNKLRQTSKGFALVQQTIASN